MKPYAKSGALATHISTSAPVINGGGSQIQFLTALLSE